ncbi:MAG: hypothetical protein JWO53_145 [Chlamydiia bacterium]|nr:hypothetical protein [Chlamydiia bacterium]
MLCIRSMTEIEYPKDGKTSHSTQEKVQLVAGVYTSIQAHVAAHLYPYLTGEITKENEKQDRPAMIDLLFEKFKKKNLKFKKKEETEIRERAFHYYVKVSIQGFYKKIELRPNFEVDPKEAVIFKIVQSALLPAVKKDFPGYKGERFLNKKIRQIFQEINLQRRKKLQRVRDGLFKGPEERSEVGISTYSVTFQVLVEDPLAAAILPPA